MSQTSEGIVKAEKGEFLVNYFNQPEYPCKRCGKDIVWGTTKKNGKKIPLEKIGFDQRRMRFEFKSHIGRCNTPSK